jgi:hypothetical protein
MIRKESKPSTSTRHVNDHVDVNVDVSRARGRLFRSKKDYHINLDVKNCPEGLHLLTCMATLPKNVKLFVKETVEHSEMHAHNGH